MEYAVKLGRFEGPYTKIISLIEERKLSITEIDLASLADDYIAYTKNLQEKDHLDISLFIVVASTLMLMKVKSLLPKIDYTTAEEKQIENLTKKLLLFDFLEKKSKSLTTLYSKSKFFSFGKDRIKRKILHIPKNLTTEAIKKSAKEILGEEKNKKYIKTIALKRSLQLEDVLYLIRSKKDSSFKLHDVSKEISDEKNVILTFLSLLELVRTGEFTAEQTTRETITIERVNVIQ